VIESVRTGKPIFKDGIIQTPADVGGWPEYRADTLPADSDKDGLPDAWERQHGLNPNDASDASRDQDGDGYTNIEEHLNGTDPTAAIDYTRPENNRSTLHR
jgi:pectate lyase